MSIGFFAYYLMGISKSKIDNIYQNRVIPIVKYENIKDIYIVNIIDTLNEYRDGNITNQDTLEVLTLAKELIAKELSMLQKSDEELFIEIKKDIDRINLIIDRVLIELNNNQSSKALEIFYLELQPEIEEIRFNLSLLITKELKRSFEDKSGLDTHFNQISIFLILSVIFISLLAYMLSVPIRRSIKRLNNNLRDKNRKLIRTSKVIDRYVISSQTDEHGLITEVSSAFCTLSGYSKNELLGKTHKIVSHQDTKRELFRDMWQTIRKKEVYKTEIKNLKKDGSVYWLDMTITPKVCDDGRVLGYIAISKDITDKKTIQNQQKQLIQQSRHAAMGEMISMIAHQWRQPLATISAIISDNTIKLKLGDTNEEDVEKSYTEINNLISYLSHTVDDFRSFFKPNKQKEHVELKELIDSSIKLISHSLKSNSITLNIDKSDDIIINTYQNEMIQVLINIIKNASDELIKQDDERLITISYYKQNLMAIIEIADNAGGIPDNIIDDIFNPYFSTKSKNGTGLGLYMSKIIITEHLGGDIEAINSDVGAIFRITLPMGE
jgi:PAS domain S-box-containing protein